MKAIKFVATIIRKNADIDDSIFNTYSEAESYINDRINGRYYSESEKKSVECAYVTGRKFEYDENGDLVFDTFNDDHIINQTVIYKHEA